MLRFLSKPTSSLSSVSSSALLNLKTRPKIRYMSSSSPPQLTLNPVESKICSLLTSFCEGPFLDQNPQKGPVTLRITGGWVRDKLLGKESNDLDIAIDKYTGLEFAESLNQYITEHSSELGINAESIHKIEKNPEKSKHLETATTKLYDLDIDFVNLRSEEYADVNSRIPTIRFGTPEEDALRRDATLNALFYNIQESKVEDFTGKGLQDLADGVLRTPLDPFETFREDPLRVLRLIRFASRFGFTITQECLAAMADPRIHDAFTKKISRERVGIEISKTLTGPRPDVGLQLIHDLNLEQVVFNVIPAISKCKAPPYNELPPSTLSVSVKSMQLLLSNDSFMTKHFSTDTPANFKLLEWLAPPYLNHKTLKAKMGKKDVSATFVYINESLKMLSISDSEIVARAIDSVPETQSAVRDINILSRKDIGLLIRQYGASWKLNVIYALIENLNYALLASNAQQILFQGYSDFFDRIYRDHLDDAWALKPLLNGGDLKQLLNRNPGAWMSNVLVRIVEYQLEHPEATKADCEEFVMSIKDEIV